jgi:two-component system, sensor histidine kinase YesM
MPLKRVIRAMNEAKKGNLSICIKDDSKDEIGEVAENFNMMLNEIRNLMDNIRHKERQKRDAELKTLQAQINPHFLSNTLNTVKWLASMQKADNIEKLITALIQLLHASTGKGEDMIPLHEELEYIKSYISIQEYKYFDKFKVNYEIEQGILEHKVPRFLLQPVIENSIIHGIEPMEGQGLIVVKAYLYDGDIKLTVKDDGVGIPPETLKSIRSQGDTGSRSRFSGIGIVNVHERIQLLFGDKYGIHIESIPGLFTTVEITLPTIK